MTAPQPSPDQSQVGQPEDLPGGLRVTEPKPGVQRFILPRAQNRWEGRIAIPLLVLTVGVGGFIGTMAILNDNHSAIFLLGLALCCILPLVGIYYAISLWHAARAVEIDDDNLYLCVKMPLLPETRRCVPLDAVESAEVMSGELWNDLAIKTPGKKIHFYAGSGPKVLEWLAQRIAAAREHAK